MGCNHDFSDDENTHAAARRTGRYPTDALGWSDLADCDRLRGVMGEEGVAVTVTISPVEGVVDALERAGCNPRGGGSEGWTAKCPGHDDLHPSLTVCQGRDGNALVKCHAGTGCELRSILEPLGLEMSDLFTENKADPSGKLNILETYDYVDGGSEVLYQVVRLVPKSFRQRRPDGKGGWVWNMQGVQRVPYRLPELLAGVKAERWIVVVEGEKDVNRLVREGFVATGNAGGAGKFLPEFARFFQGAKVAIIPDNDQPGRDHATLVASVVGPVATEVRVVELPELSEHGDVSDWLDADGTAGELKLRITSTPAWKPRGSGGVTTAEVDVLPANERTIESNFAEVPAPTTTEVLEDVLVALRRYVVFPLDAQTVAIALWVLNTYVFDLHDSTPYLNITSATKQAGKSRLFEVLNLLVARPYLAVEATEAVLFRKIAADTPTLLLDEIDTCFGKESTMTEGLRAVLNAGYRRGATVPRCVGPNHELKDFPVFCPKAFAGIGERLPDTVVDRSIPIELRRRAPAERQVARFRQTRARSELTPLRDRIRAWGAAASEALSVAEPALPDELSDRQQDSWEPLLAIADLAGGEWSDRARTAAVTLHGGVVDQDVGVLLLAHIRDLFDEQEADELSTEELLGGLINRGDDSPWPRWWSEDVERKQTKGPASQLARKLKPYAIKPEQLWLSGNKVRGYRRSAFADSWSRYLQSELSPTAPTPNKDGRTVDRRSQANSHLGDGSVESSTDQDPTDLPFEQSAVGRGAGKGDSRPTVEDGSPPRPVAGDQAQPADAEMAPWETTAEEVAL